MTQTASVFRRFVEVNRPAREVWTFWLQVRGSGIDNAAELCLLAELLEALGFTGDPTRSQDPDAVVFRLFDDVLDVEQVDLLARFISVGEYDVGTFPPHLALFGRFICPRDLGERASLLRRGRIREHFALLDDARGA